MGHRPKFWPDLGDKIGMAPFKLSARQDKLDSTCTGRMPGSAVRLGAIRVVVSAVLFMSMASGTILDELVRVVHLLLS